MQDNSVAWTNSGAKNGRRGRRGAVKPSGTRPGLAKILGVGDQFRRDKLAQNVKATAEDVAEKQTKASGFAKNSFRSVKRSGGLEKI